MSSIQIVPRDGGWHASLDFMLPAYPSRGVYNLSIGREDVAACIPEDGPRGLGFKG